MKQIVVLQRGWVIVGDFAQSGDQCEVTNGHVVRRWGTSAGLGELAMKGPLENTKLDKIPTTRFHQLGIIARFECDVEKWSGV